MVQQLEICFVSDRSPVGSWIGSDFAKKIKDLYANQNSKLHNK